MNLMRSILFQILNQKEVVLLVMKRKMILLKGNNINILNYFLPNFFFKSNKSNQCSFGVGRYPHSIVKTKDISPGPKYNTSKTLGVDAPSCIMAKVIKQKTKNGISSVLVQVIQFS